MGNLGQSIISLDLVVPNMSIRLGSLPLTAPPSLSPIGCCDSAPLSTHQGSAFLLLALVVAGLSGVNQSDSGGLILSIGLFSAFTG